MFLLGLALAAAAAQPPPSPDFAVAVDGQQQTVYQAAVQGAFGGGVTNSSFVIITLPAGGGAVAVTVTVLGRNGSAPVRTAALRPRGSPAVRLQGAAAVTFELDAPGR